MGLASELVNVMNVMTSLIGGLYVFLTINLGIIENICAI